MIPACSSQLTKKGNYFSRWTEIATSAKVKSWAWYQQFLPYTVCSSQLFAAWLHHTEVKCEVCPARTPSEVTSYCWWNRNIVKFLVGIRPHTPCELKYLFGPIFTPREVLSGGEKAFQVFTSVYSENQRFYSNSSAE